MELIQIKPGSRFYDRVSNMFDDEWLHSQKTGKLVSIYVIKNAKKPGLQLRFHGTQRACYIGSNSLEPCNNSECYLCNILKNGFSLQNANPASMFGPGTYTSVVSSKADIYAKNHHVRSHKHVLIICGVDRGRSKIMKVAGHPGPGYDSIEAATKAEGGVLEYPETVVFNQNNIKPLGLVVYTRDGWTPR